MNNINRKELESSLKSWLEYETKGLKKKFDKNTPIFSYNDVLEFIDYFRGKEDE